MRLGKQSIFISLSSPIIGAHVHNIHFVEDNMSHEFQIGFVCVAQADEFRIDGSFVSLYRFWYTHNHAFVKRVYNAVSRIYSLPMRKSIRLASLSRISRLQHTHTHKTDTPNKFNESSSSFIFVLSPSCRIIWSILLDIGTYPLVLHIKVHLSESYNFN